MTDPNPSTESSDKLVSDMAQELLKGATLTDVICPECDTPLLRNKNGETYCAKCKRPVIMVDSAHPAPQQSSPPTSSPNTPTPSTTTLGILQQVLQQKVTELTNLLAQTQDPKTAYQILETIDKLLEVYQKSRQIR